MIGKLRFASLAWIIALAILGCGGPTRSTLITRASRKAPIDPWILSTLDASDTTPALLWNGSIGVRIGRDSSGTSQPFFSIDEYNTSGEEKIRSLRSPLANGFTLDGKPLPITGDYQQSLNMKTSELTTHWTSGSLSVDCVTILHPQFRQVVQRWTLKGANEDQQIDFDLGLSGKLGKAKMLLNQFTIPQSDIRFRSIVKTNNAKNSSVDVILTIGNSSNRSKMHLARLPGTFPAKAGEFGW